MRKSRSIRSRVRKKRLTNEFDLQLTSMLDIFVIILVFLLKAYMSTSTHFSMTQNLTLPISISPEVPTLTSQILISKDAILFDQEKVVTLAGLKLQQEDLDSDKVTIKPLFAALMKARDKENKLKASAAASAEKKNVSSEKGFAEAIAIQTDKQVSYDLLRKVIYTAALAGYGEFRLLAMKVATE